MIGLLSVLSSVATALGRLLDWLDGNAKRKAGADDILLRQAREAAARKRVADEIDSRPVPSRLNDILDRL